MRCVHSDAMLMGAFVVVSRLWCISRSWRFAHNVIVLSQFVALGGLVWNFPTSCAWAARVYVSHR